ncbi:RNase adapter RapZ [Pseudomonas aeruginosa]|nr:RNase adapter RapZ [Pseudomonas aeruginosa]
MRLIIVSGRSGSGKSTALNVLEDNGFYCIDNLPASLLPDLAQRALLHTELLQPQVAVSIDARNLPSQLQRFPELLQEVRDNHINCDVLYLDADDETLLKRFSETRRRHPLTTDTRSLAEAIGDESQLLGPIADLADLKLDTTSLNLYQLRDTIKLRLLNKPEPGTAFLVESFGFKRGMPVDADLVFDVRCLPNPYWKPELRDHSGLEPEVREYLAAQPDVEEMYQDIVGYLNKWLPRFAASLPLDTAGMRLQRRISATYKDLPGGQLLGPTFDYTHRLLDFSLLAEGDYPGPEVERGASLEPCPRVLGLLDREGLMTPEYELPGAVPDITREPLDFPTGRAQRLQALARGDEGFLLALGYSTQRGYGRNHPFAGEIRIGACEVWLEPEELGFAVPVGEIEVTECEMVNQFVGSREELPQFTRGYGLAFGYAERKAMGMALVDRALRAEEYGEEVVSPAQQEEFVLMHCDNVEAGGFVSHLKLPHYVDFQSELELIRKLRRPGVAESAQPTVQEKRA